MRTWLRFTLIGTTIVGGLWGIGVTLRDLFSSERGFGASVVSGCILLGFVYVTTAGLLFWRDPKQVRPLIWALAIQIPWISMPGLAYKFEAGWYWSIALVATQKAETFSIGFGTKGDIASSCELMLFQDSQLELGINAAALALLVLLRRSIQSTANTVEGQSSTVDAKAQVPQSQPDQTPSSPDNR